MKLGPTTFLKVVIILVGLASIAGLLWFPQTEGRADGLDLVNIYADPLIIYSFIASLPFFYWLSQAYKLLSLIEQNKAFSKQAHKTLSRIKYASVSLIVFIALGISYIRFFANGDDSAGPSMLGAIMALSFGVSAAIASLFQNQILRKKG